MHFCGWVTGFRDMVSRPVPFPVEECTCSALGSLEGKYLESYLMLSQSLPAQSQLSCRNFLEQRTTARYAQPSQQPKRSTVLAQPPL